MHDETLNGIMPFFSTNFNYLSELDTQYPYWTKVKAKAKADSLPPKEVWFCLKIQRETQIVKLNFKEILKFNIPSIAQEYLHQLDLNCGGTLQSVVKTPITENERKRYILSSLSTEAYASSVIEGAVITKEKAKEIINAEKAPKNESEKMILNNYKAMEYITENKDTKLTLSTLYELHEILLSGTLEESKVGRFRNPNENIVIVDILEGETVYTPPFAEEVGERIALLIDFFNNENTKAIQPTGRFIHPIVKAIIIHFMIGYIHPFYDGNGRIARALFYWHILANGYWLGEYLSISQVILKSKAQYYKAFMYVENDDNDMTYFIIYHLEAIRKAYDQLLMYIERKQKTEGTVHTLAISSKITPRQAEILMILKSTASIWTIQQIISKILVSPNTARADLNVLTANGLIKRSDYDKKTQGWHSI